MKNVKIFLALMVSFLLGCTFSLWYQSASRMSDEYIYAIDASNVLFEVRPELGSELSVKLNKVLLTHLNRFVVAKQFVPSLFVEELEDIFCSSFNINSKGMNGFGEIASEKVQQYLIHATSYCSYESEI